MKKIKKLPLKAAHSSKNNDLRLDIKTTKNLKSSIELIKRNLRGEPTSSLPYDAKPMLASITNEPFNNEEWLFEIKWDGYRALASIDKGNIQLQSRNNKSFNEKFKVVYDALKKWPVRAVVDGEVVVLNEEGKSDFKALQEWHHMQRGEMVYYVFDILWLDGIDLTNLPLDERKKILRQITPEEGIIRYSDSIEEYGVDFYEIAKKNGLEGIIAKEKASVYQTNARSKSWLKIKIEQKHEAIICGYTKKRGTSRQFSSLVLGIKNEEGELQFIGQVGTGFDNKMQQDLMQKMKSMVIAECPFSEEPQINDQTIWVKLALVCEVKYTELTSEGVMRHPSFQGLREDKNVSDVNNELQLTKGKKAPAASSKGLLINPEDENKIVTINKQQLKFTNLQKPFWIKEKISKGDLLNYYDAVEPYIMPYLKDRPQSLHRFPNGIENGSFYQKDMGGKVDKWIKTFRRFSASVQEDKDFMICTDKASMLYMINLGCIELNPWHSRVQTPHYPDWSVIDLDPGNISFEKVIETAIVVKKVLDALQVPSFPKTSGSTGIHIYVPLGAKYNYDQSKQFAELVAHLVHEELPVFTSLVRNPEKRKDKIYIDYLQNRPIQTICAPYSVRPKKGATVSAPLHWDEVKKGLSIEQFTMFNIFDRLKIEGDLFSGVLNKAIDLNKVLKSLSLLF